MRLTVCPDRSRLTSALVGELPEVETDEVTEHLDHCQACSAVALEIEQANACSKSDPPLDESPLARQELANLVAWAKGLVPDSQLADALEGIPIVGPERYELLNEIDHGGMGRIFQARDLVLDRYVAMKLPADHLSHSSVARRFLAEARTSGRLRHPGILPIYELGKLADGRLFFTMPLIEGNSLSTLLAERRGTPDQLPRLVNIFHSVCQTLAFAHSHGIIHRDLKPANIMVGRFGEVLLIDWGLSKLLFKDDPASAWEPAIATSCATVHTGEGLTLADAVMGTAAYMAPEQARGEVDRIDKRSDVFSLGAILCEILTGQPPYIGSKADVLAAARAAQLDGAYARLDVASDRELAVIAKAWLAPSPEVRPRDASIAVQQLEAHQGRAAQRLQEAEQTAKERRTKIRVLAVATTLIAVISAAAYWQVDRARRAAVRQDLIQQQLAVRTNAHASGWSQQALDLVAQANRVVRGDDLRDGAAAALVGMDAKLDAQHNQIGGTLIAWNNDRGQLLLGGENYRDGKPRFDASVWDPASYEELRSGLNGAGPVAWRDDGVAIQAIAPNPNTIEIRDVRGQRTLHQFGIPAQEELARRADDELPLIVLSRDGGTVAAAIMLENDTARLLAWETAVGGVPVMSADVVAKDRLIMSISPQGRLVATGDNDGRINIWTPGRKDPIARLFLGRSSIESLAFGRDAWSDPDAAGADDSEGPLLLAAADAGGQVAVWDLASQKPRVFCRGTLWDVTQMAFSGDSATLATGGRYSARLWDIATGRQLLELKADDTVVGIDFSTDGKRLAITANDSQHPSSLFIYDLLDQRGLQQLRGLRAQAMQIRFSRDGKYIAALSSEWQLAVWEMATGNLRRVLPTPKGMTADNAGFAISPDGKKIAFATSGAARLWDIDAGRLLDQWILCPGIQDQLAFHSSGKLLLVRAELTSRKWYSRPDSQADPLVCRTYELAADGAVRPLATNIQGFGRKVNALVFSSDGERFVVDGYPGPDYTHRHVAAFDTFTGKSRWDQPSNLDHPPSACLSLDPLGATVSAAMPRCELWDVRTGKALGQLSEGSGAAIGPEGRYSIGQLEYGYGLYQLGNREPLVKLGIDQRTSSYVPAFNPAGTHVAWGNADGTVTLCEIPLVRRQLAELNLDWRD